MGPRWLVHGVMGVIGMVSMLAGCRGGEDARRSAMVPPAVGVPRRTAAESADMRALATDLVADRACEEIRGAIHPLRAGGRDQAAGEQPVTGRVWLERCRVRQQDDGLALEIGGRGWRWIERKTEMLGATFAIDQYVRFAVDFDVTAAVDVAYAVEDHLLHLWLTPTEPIQATFESIGDIEVRTASSWSSALGWASEVLPMDSADQRAQERLSRKGRDQAASALKRGYSLVMDLCTGERHARLGVIPEGEIPGQGGKAQGGEPQGGEQQGRKEQAGEAPGTRVRLYPGGIDLAGPFRPDRHPLVIELEVLEGPGVDARMVCRADARRAMDAFLAGQPLPELTPRAALRVGPVAPARLRVEDECELMLLTRPLQPDQGGLFRMHVAQRAAEHSSMLDCTRDDRTRE